MFNIGTVLVHRSLPEQAKLVVVAIEDTKIYGVPLKQPCQEEDLEIEVNGQIAGVDCYATTAIATADYQVFTSLGQDSIDTILRQRHRATARAYYQMAHASRSDFNQSAPSVPVSGRVFGAKELETLGDACLDFWLTSGRFEQEFTREFIKETTIANALTVNSGSSANLLAVTALSSPMLGPRRLHPGDEIITVAAGFPTTVSPIIQNNFIPVFVDVDPQTYNVNVEELRRAITDKTKAIILAHTLGNPFNLTAVSQIAKDNGLWLIEDCCDALGAKFLDHKGVLRPCGTFGDIATFSFYPAHHITMGEGGVVATSDKKLHRILLSLRDWGRDCWCDPGADNSCKNRFNYQHGTLPFGYDHKYVYSHLGYNLKITDMQAAVGLAQLQRLPKFLAARKNNYELLTELLRPLGDYLLLPQVHQGGHPAWFGLPLQLTDKGCAKGTREDLLRFLNKHNIGTRLLFAGNMLRQPFMAGQKSRQLGKLAATDLVMERVFWIGVFPGLDEAHLRYVATKLDQYFNEP